MLTRYARCWTQRSWQSAGCLGDGLPGLVVDRCGDYVVVQIASVATELIKDLK